MKKKIKIQLCDFVHDYLGAGTFMFPLNIGYIAAYTNKFFPKDVEIKLFKYPKDFLDQFKKEKPDLVGLGNYTWNADLNNRVSGWIKSIAPETIVVFGGPNIDYSPKGYKRFFATHPAVDFYVLYQGETPFVGLIKEIFDKSLNLSRLKSKVIDDVIFYDKASDSIIQGKELPRIKEPDTIPSPYLTGLLDEFFDINLIPIVETNRGCPYSCTYCCQGLVSHNKIEFYSSERIKEELKYIANKVKNTNILIFADSNFGIIKRDMEITQYIAKLVKETGYPRKVNMYWAKNQPKIFEIAKILKNINLLVSLQSLDKTVLGNIKRQNIQISIFKEIIERINKEGGISGTEIILGLPGETKASHLESIRKLFNWNVSYIICYYCLLLEGSEMSLDRESGRFKCKTKFQLIDDNSFGKYDDIVSFEVAEGIRSTPTMSEEEILYFRPVHWLIQFLWNYRFYYDLLKFLQSLEINPLDYITKLIDDADSTAPESIKKIFKEFKREAKAEWFDSTESLRQYYSQPKVFDWLTKGNYGKMNSKFIFKILLEARSDFEDYLCSTAIKICGSKKEVFIRELLKILSAAIIDFTKDEIFKEKTVKSLFNILEWRKSRYEKNLESFWQPEGNKFKFLLYVPEEQKKSLKTLLKQYKHKNKNVTLRKMSEFMDVRDFLRKVKSFTRKQTLAEPSRRIYGKRTDRTEKILAQELGKDYVEYRKKWIKASKREIVTDFPLYIQIEHSGKCNLRCPTCIQGIKALRENYSRDFRPLDIKLYKKILAEAKCHNCPSISFHNNDEPLILADLEARIKLAKEADFLDIILVTNATLLTAERSRELLNSGITKISFSLDGWNEEVYKQVRPGGDFSAVLRNIEYFLKEKRRNNLQLPITRATCVLSKFTYEDMEKFRKFWQKRVDLVEFNNFQALKGYTEDLRPPGAKVDSNFTCNAPWQQVVIRPNGDVLPCCSFYSGASLVLGNIKSSSIYALWHGSKMGKIRRELKSNNFSFSPVCKNCSETFYSYEEKNK